MSYELIGESVKSAISIKLGDLFKTPKTQNGQVVMQNGQVVYDYPIRYKENITQPQYPNFFITQLSCNMTPMQTKVEGALNKDLKRIKFDYFMNIKYRVAEDTELITNLRQQLDAVSFILLAKFTEIDLGFPVYTKNCRSEIADGILHFFFNITVYATNDQVDEIEMAQLNIEETIGEQSVLDFSNIEQEENEEGEG